MKHLKLLAGVADDGQVCIEITGLQHAALVGEWGGEGYVHFNGFCCTPEQHPEPCEA